MNNLNLIGGLQPVSKGKGAKKTRKSRKDKPKQKRAPTAFILFSNAQRPEVKAKWPNVTFSEYGKIIGEMWAGLSLEAKKVWTDQAAERKREIDIQRPPKVSRPPTPYQLFCSEIRPRIKQENPAITFGETGRLLGAKWAALDEVTKNVYIQTAAEKKANWPGKHGIVPVAQQEDDDDDDDDESDDED